MSEPAGGAIDGETAGGETAADLRARLERSRTGLLAALAQLTEQDFASELEAGRSVLELLADLAQAERAASAAARAGGGLPARPAAGRGSLLAPQVVHDLAGARHETLLALAEIGDAEPPPEALRAVAEREDEAAAVIREWFRGRRA